MAQLPLGFGKGPREGDDEPPQRIQSVSQIQNQLRRELEARYRRVSVRGEMSNLRVPSSGHGYFSLKDRRAQLRCFMWQNDLARLPFRAGNGLEVVATGRLTVYDKSGDLQLQVEKLELHGTGALWEQFERLKRKLEAEGLMDPAIKKPLPAYPKRIGIVTSLAGAALRDVLRAIYRRDPLAHVVLADSKVQGRAVAFQIVSAIRRLDERGETDVIIVCRGGGSIEDLWAFNEEPVARAIAAAKTPIVTGIGHETDTTIADLVSDLRASTPTAAAERVAFERNAIAERIRRLEHRLHRVTNARVTKLSLELSRLERRLRDPSATIRRRAQTIDGLLGEAERHVTDRIDRDRRRLAALERKLEHASPAARIARASERLRAAEARHAIAGKRALETRRARLSASVLRLDALSPLAVLGRGYALVTAEDGRVVRAATDVTAGDRVDIRLSEGRIAARVEPSDDG